LTGNFAKISLRMEFKKRFAKKSDVPTGTVTVSLPDVFTENFALVDQALCLIITSPKSLSCSDDILVLEAI
jgi:hypothetical protein